MIFQSTQGKLAGETLNTDGLLEHLPFLKEILDAKELTRSQLDNFARDASSLRRLRAGDVVCEEGDFGSTAFYLVSGRVEVSINNPLASLRTRRSGGGFLGRGIAQLKRMTSFLVPDDAATVTVDAKNYIPIDAPVNLSRQRPIAELGAGEIFGEMTCRTFQPRSATITCLEDCVIVEMLRVVLDMLTGNRAVSEALKSTTKVKAATFKGSPTFRRLTDDKYRTRNLATHLRGVPMFASLDEAFLQELTHDVELVSYSADEVVVTQGEPADAFYLVRSGMVKVSTAMPGGDLVRTYLSRGDYFGEIGLLTPEGVRTATCRVLDQTDLVRIKRDLFEQILEKYPAVRVQLKLIADARLRSLQARRLPVGQNMEEFLGQGLFEAQNLLLIDLDKCTRCDACVTACAEAHDGVTRLLRDGLRYDRYLVATACRSCHDPLCMTQCPVGSIRRKDSLEIQIESWCIGCSKCAELCPYGNINMHPFEAPEKPKPAAKPAAAAPAAGAPAGAAKPAGAPGAASAAGAAKPAAAAKPAGAPAAEKTASDAPAKTAGAPAAEKPAANAAAKPAGAAPKPAAQAAPPTPAADAASQAPAPKIPPAEAAGKPAPAITTERPVIANDLPPPTPEPAVAPEAKAAPATMTAAVPTTNPSPAPDPRGDAVPAPSAVATPAAVKGVEPSAIVAPVAAKSPASSPTAAAKPAAAKLVPAAGDKPAAAKPAPAATDKPAAVAAKPTPAAGDKPAAAAKPAPAAAAPAKPADKNAPKKKAMTLKATTCDLCTDLLTPSCVYACPHDAAMRVDPARYFAGQKSATDRRRRSWLRRWFLKEGPDNRTTH